MEPGSRNINIWRARSAAFINWKWSRIVAGPSAQLLVLYRSWARHRGDQAKRRVFNELYHLLFADPLCYYLC